MLGFSLRNLLLSEDWRLEMMKTLHRPESFSRNFSKPFQANIKKRRCDASSDWLCNSFTNC